MEKLFEKLQKLPVLNVIAAIVCLVGVPFHFIAGRDLYATILTIVGLANVWRVYVNYKRLTPTTLS